MFGGGGGGHGIAKVEGLLCATARAEAVLARLRYRRLILLLDHA